MKIAILADSSSCLEYAPIKNNVIIIPTSIHFGTEVFVDGRDIKADEFYNKLENSSIVPSTSSPSLGDFVAILTKLKGEGYTDVIHFSISVKLSNYSINLQTIIESYELGINFHVFDCHSAIVMQGLVAHYAEILAQQGNTVQTIFDECDKLAKQMDAYFVVDNLKYLVQNGRLSKFSGTIGEIIMIKPILRLDYEGIIAPFEKVRTHKKALGRTLEIIKEKASKYEKCLMMSLHTNRLEDCLENEAILRETSNCQLTLISTITPTVGAHIGSKVLGVACVGFDGLKIDYLEMLKNDIK